MGDLKQVLFSPWSRLGESLGCHSKDTMKANWTVFQLPLLTNVSLENDHSLNSNFKNELIRKKLHNVDSSHQITKTRYKGDRKCLIHCGSLWHHNRLTTSHLLLQMTVLPCSKPTASSRKQKNVMNLYCNLFMDLCFIR